MTSNESISPSFAQKRYLGWSDIDIKANREFLRKDKELRWELTQIETLGPDWKNQVAAQAEAAGGAGGPPPPAGGGGGGGMPPMGGAGGPPPSEVGSPEGETGGAPETEAPATEQGATTTPEV